MARASWDLSAQTKTTVFIAGFSFFSLYLLNALLERLCSLFFQKRWPHTLEIAVS